MSAGPSPICILSRPFFLHSSPYTAFFFSESLVDLSMPLIAKCGSSDNILALHLHKTLLVTLLSPLEETESSLHLEVPIFQIHFPQLQTPQHWGSWTAPNMDNVWERDLWRPTSLKRSIVVVDDRKQSEETQEV